MSHLKSSTQTLRIKQSKSSAMSSSKTWETSLVSDWKTSRSCWFTIHSWWEASTIAQLKASLWFSVRDSKTRGMLYKRKVVLEGTVTRAQDIRLCLIWLTIRFKLTTSPRSLSIWPRGANELQKASTVNRFKPGCWETRNQTAISSRLIQARPSYLRQKEPKTRGANWLRWDMQTKLKTNSRSLLILLRSPGLCPKHTNNLKNLYDKLLKIKWNYTLRHHNLFLSFHSESFTHWSLLHSLIVSILNLFWNFPSFSITV